MAQAMTKGKVETVTLATTLTQLTFAAGQHPSYLHVFRSAATNIYITFDGSVADGAAVPTDRITIPASSLPLIGFPIRGRAKVLIADDSGAAADIMVD